MLTTEKRDPPEEDDSQSKKLQYKITKCKIKLISNFLFLISFVVIYRFIISNFFLLFLISFYVLNF
jgi:hypothetical protein